MKTADLKKFMALANKLNVKNPTLAACGYLWYEAGTLTINDLTTTIHMDADFGDQPFCIEFKMLNGFLKSVDGNTKIIIKPDGIFVDGQLVSSYSQMADIEDRPGALLADAKAKQYRFMIQPNRIIKIAQFAANDELRPVLNCVYYDQVNYVATDAHILCMEKTTPTTISDFPNCLFPKWMVAMLPKQDVMWLNYFHYDCPDAAGDGIDWDNSARLFEFEHDKMVITTRGEFGKYPNYMGVVPSEQNNDQSHRDWCAEDESRVYKPYAERNPFEILYNINRVALKNAVTLALPSADSVTNAARFTFYENQLVILAQDKERETKSELTIKENYRGIVHRNLNNFNHLVGFAIGFNLKFMLKVLNYLDDNAFRVQVQAPNRGTIINDKIILMPVDLNNL